MVARLRRSADNRVVSIGLLLSIFLSPVEPATAQQSANQVDCLDGEARGASLESQIRACTDAIELGKGTKWNLGIAFFKRGTAYHYKGDSDRAIADYNRAIQLGLYVADVFNNRGILYTAQGDLDRAISDLNEALRLDPRHSRAFNNRGNAYYVKGDYSRAMIDYNDALRYDPGNADAYNNRC